MTENGHGYTANKDAVLKRVRRVEGQIRGIERMVEEDRYCIDVVTQITAVQAALDKVAPRSALRHRCKGLRAGRANRGADGRGQAADAARLGAVWVRRPTSPLPEAFIATVCAFIGIGIVARTSTVGEAAVTTTVTRTGSSTRRSSALATDCGLSACLWASLG